MPTVWPCCERMCEIRRVVVVFPLVPVTAQMGTECGLPSGNNISTTGFAIFLGVPSDGCRCILKPGPAFTSRIPARCGSNASSKVSAIKSIPITFRPMMRDTRSAIT